MTTLLLLVLALVWVGVGVLWWRSRTEPGIGDSVGTFRRHLHVLERTAPTMPPVRGRGGYNSGVSSSPSVRLGQASQGGMGRGLGRGTPSAAAARRRQSQRRRRDVLATLIVATIGMLLIAAVTGSKAVIFLQVLCDIALGGYIALLVRLRNLAAERDMKLTYLSRQRMAPTAARPPAPARRPAPARGGRVGRPAAVGGYELAPGYGDMGLRRAAN